MSDNLINLYGASGHAKVIIDVCKQNDAIINLIVDDNPKINNLLNYRVHQPSAVNFNKGQWIISVGNNDIRKKLVASLSLQYASLIHPKSIIDPTVTIGKGTVVMAGAIINSAVTIGQHNIINTGATVDHDCNLEDYVHISPNATLCGGISVGEGTQVGAGAVIIPNIEIGKWCTIGAGAVVFRDIPDGATVVGNPGRILRLKK